MTCFLVEICLLLICILYVTSAFLKHLRVGRPFNKYMNLAWLTSIVLLASVKNRKREANKQNNKWITYKYNFYFTLNLSVTGSKFVSLPFGKHREEILQLVLYGEETMCKVTFKSNSLLKITVLLYDPHLSHQYVHTQKICTHVFIKDCFQKKVSSHVNNTVACCGCF